MSADIAARASADEALYHVKQGWRIDVAVYSAPAEPDVPGAPAATAARSASREPAAPAEGGTAQRP